MINLYFPQFAKIKNIKNASADSKLFTLTLPNQKKFKFKSGQFVMAGIAGFGEAPFDICSNPQEVKNFLEISARKTGKLTSVMHKLKTGAILTVRGPFGNNFPGYQKDDEILLIGGGCGFVTFRSIILEHISKHKNYNKPKVILGAKNESLMLFKDEYQNWKSGIDFYISLEQRNLRRALSLNSFPCVSKGMITDILEKININPRAKAFLCGPPIMYKFVIAKLQEKGVKDENIYLSLERRMHCGAGVCQHCAIGDKYVCKDGPVFNYAELKGTEVF